MTYYHLRLLRLISIDLIIILCVVYLSWLFVGYDTDMPLIFYAMSTTVILFSHLLLSSLFNFYKKVWAYASTGELLIVLQMALYTGSIGGIAQLIFGQTLYVKFLVVTMIIYVMFIGGSRFVWRLYRDGVMNKKTDYTRTLIIGAGSAGTMVARQLQHNNGSTLLPVGFIDDDEKKHDLDILGIPVLGGVEDIPHIVNTLSIDHMIIAIPSLNRRELHVIFQTCIKTKVKTKILPLLEDLVTGKISVNQCRDVELDDLLAREPVHLDLDRIVDEVTGKTVLVTGAGGSIGSEIARQVSKFNPKQLILLGHGENSIYAIEMELKKNFKEKNIQFMTEIADVQHEQKMRFILNTYKPDVVYHTAAHKHVPLMERHPEEAVKNNIIGTLNVARAASESFVNTFVMVSTDKAVHPTSVMGATKKIAEMVVQQMNKQSETKFVTVRFGNVLGSKGSVIPLFKKQIEQGGPVTVTHPDMVRYFMTIPEASKLVMQAGALANGGEIFVLDMGEPVKIVDLAKNLIHLSGYSLDEVGLEFTGIRPGEKLYEELLDEDEVVDNQLYPKIHIGKTTHVYWGDIEWFIENFMNMDNHVLRETLLDLAHGRALRQAEPVYSIQN